MRQIDVHELADAAREADSGANVAYRPGTQHNQPEMERVLAIGAPDVRVTEVDWRSRCAAPAAASAGTNSANGHSYRDAS